MLERWVALGSRRRKGHRVFVYGRRRVLPQSMRFRTAAGDGDTGVDFHYPRAFNPIAGEAEMPLGSLDFQCWNGAADPFVDDDVLVIGWNIPSDQLSSHPFDFCIGEVRPMLREAAPELLR